MSCMLVTSICMQTLNIITVTDINKETSAPRVINSSFRRNDPQDRLQEVKAPVIHLHTSVCAYVYVSMCTHLTNRALEGSEKPTRSWCQCHLLTCSLSRSRTLTPTLTLQLFLSSSLVFVSSSWFFCLIYSLLSFLFPLHLCRWRKNHLSFLTLCTLLKFLSSHSGCCCCFVPLISLFLRVNTDKTDKRFCRFQ